MKLTCVDSIFLLMNGWVTRSNQMQCKKSFTEAHVVSLVKEATVCQNSIIYFMMSYMHKDKEYDTAKSLLLWLLSRENLL